MFCKPREISAYFNKYDKVCYMVGYSDVRDRKKENVSSLFPSSKPNDSNKKVIENECKQLKRVLIK